MLNMSLLKDSVLTTTVLYCIAKCFMFFSQFLYIWRLRNFSIRKPSQHQNSQIFNTKDAFGGKY